ncbi:MAG: hypothetical protein ACOC57_03480 [Acidobacteriota bacterium]
MELTLNQFLLLVLTLSAAVVAAVLVVFLLQMRKTAREGQAALVEFRSFIHHLEETTRSLNLKLEDAGEILDASKKVAFSLSEIAWFTAFKVIRPSSRYWPLVFPLVRLGWRQLKKRKKEDKHGQQ